MISGFSSLLSSFHMVESLHQCVEPLLCLITVTVTFGEVACHVDANLFVVVFLFAVVLLFMVAFPLLTACRKAQPRQPRMNPHDSEFNHDEQLVPSRPTQHGSLKTDARPSGKGRDKRTTKEVRSPAKKPQEDPSAKPRQRPKVKPVFPNESGEGEADFQPRRARMDGDGEFSQSSRQHNVAKLSLPSNSLAIFDGERVLEWLEDVQDIIFGAHKFQESEWLDYLPAYLSGRAKDFFRSELRGKPWSVVRKAFLDTYHSPLIKSKLTQDLNVIKQKDNESVSEYYNRVRALARKVDPFIPELYLGGYVKKGLKDVRLHFEFSRRAQQPLDSLMDELAILESAYLEAEQARTTSTTTTTSTFNSVPVKPVFQLEQQLDMVVNEVRQGQLVTLSELYNEHPRNRPHRFCQRCQMKGHSSEDCHKLVSCQLCDRKGHTAKKCWANRPQSRDNTTRSNSNLEPVNDTGRVVINDTGRVVSMPKQPRGGYGQNYREQMPNQEMSRQFIP